MLVTALVLDVLVIRKDDPAHGSSGQAVRGERPSSAKSEGLDAGRPGA